MDKKSFIFLTILLLLLIINNIYSIEEGEIIYYINFDLSDPDFKYENES